jgi:hypothetical protein
MKTYDVQLIDGQTITIVAEEMTLDGDGIVAFWTGPCRVGIVPIARMNGVTERMAADDDG